MKRNVEGHTNLQKDMASGVVINNDTSGRERYRMAKRAALQNIESQRTIVEMRQEIDELKDLVKQMLNK